MIVSVAHLSILYLSRSPPCRHHSQNASQQSRGYLQLYQTSRQNYSSILLILLTNVYSLHSRSCLLELWAVSEGLQCCLGLSLTLICFAGERLIVMTLIFSSPIQWMMARHMLVSHVGFLSCWISNHHSTYHG